MCQALTAVYKTYVRDLNFPLKQENYLYSKYFFLLIGKEDWGGGDH